MSVPRVSAAQVLGTVAGTVRDPSGAVLPGVTVEASSPALIEKVRTAVTDGAGQYRIVNLPPGTYVVTFTLTGFSTVRREGVEVSINVTSNIDAQLRVGDLKETITVSGETPVVDLQSTAQTTVADERTFKELPSGGSWVNIAQLVPAINSAFFGNRDVGGTQGDQTGTQVSVHGGIPGDGVSMIDGMRIGNMYLSSNLTNMSLSALIYDEVNISFSGQTPESGTNGVIMNAIPKSGGNEFHGSLLANGSAPSLQGSNVNDRLRARGASDTDSLKKLYDINGAIGGPIKRDKLWFYFTSRYFTNEYDMAGQYFAVDPSAFVRTPDLTRQAFSGTWTADNNIRADVGAHGEAEDLGLVRVPAQGRCALAAADSLHVAGSGATGPVADAVEHHHVDLHRHEPRAASKRGWRPARALTRSSSPRTTSRASRSSSSAARTSRSILRIERHGSTITTTASRRRPTRAR